MLAASKIQCLISSIVVIVLATAFVCNVEAEMESQAVCNFERKYPWPNKPVTIKSASGDVSIDLAGTVTKWQYEGTGKRYYNTLKLESVESNDKELILNMDCGKFKLTSHLPPYEYQIEGEVNVEGKVIECKSKLIDIEQAAVLCSLPDMTVVVSFDTLNITQVM